MLADIVGSREADRPASHAALLGAIDEANATVPQRDPLRVTVGDEVQGVYATPGEAFRALFTLRAALDGVVDLRFGLGLGEVRVIDADRGIQDGDAWAAAREAVEAVEAAAREPGAHGLRVAVRGEVGNPLVEPLSQLVDAQLAALGDGPRASFWALRAGLDNRTAAERLGVSPSANSQRVTHNALRTLLAAVHALQALS